MVLVPTELAIHFCMPREFVCATTADAASIDVAAEAVAIRILHDLEVPRRVKFTPSQLAQDVGGTARSWQRACQLGEIGAVRIPGGWLVTWRELVAYMARHQNVVSTN